jgi:hypothetical protein
MPLDDFAGRLLLVRARGNPIGMFGNPLRFFWARSR